MKSHIGPNGPGKCTASVKDCPFGGEDNHFHTIVEARQEYEARLEKAYAEESSVKSTKLKLTKIEQELRAKNASQAKEIVALRAQVGGVTFEDANPVRAKRRLEEAITFAESRGNTHLIDKLSHASVLPSGAFKLEDGSRANTDSYLKAKQALDDIESGRKELLSNIDELVKDNPTIEKQFTLKTDAGTFSLKLEPGYDEKEFEKLPLGLQEKLKSDKPSLSIDAARKALSPERLAEVTTTSQVLDFVIGKPVETAVAKVEIKKELTGDTTDEKVKSGLKNIADFYAGAHKEVGTAKSLKAVKTDNNTAVKAATASTEGPVFVPARSQSNGLLVTHKQTLNKSKLTPEEIARVTVTKRDVDSQLARTVLPTETFDKIFGATKASLRVTEAA
jgi:hypothetical protein